jgi:hypothetical protein
LLLAKAATEKQQKFVGNQTAVKVFLLAHNAFEKDSQNLLANKYCNNKGTYG